MSWKTDLRQAIAAEKAAEKAATQAEGERRRTWWATTWALAGVPRAEWGEAQTLYVDKTGHSKRTADRRRTVGTRLPETRLAAGLPMPRFAQEAADWIGVDGDEAKVKEAVKLLADAERNEMSLREFAQMLTGRPWTNTAENMTEADEDAVLARVARTRPAAFVAPVASSPRVRHEAAKALINTPEAIEITRETMADPKNAQVVLGSIGSPVDSSVMEARVERMRARPARPQPQVDRSTIVGSGTKRALELGILYDRIALDFDHLMGFIATMDDETAEVTREWLQDVVLLQVQGCLEAIAMRGHEMSVGDFE